MVTGPFGTTRQGPRAGFAIDERFPSPAGRERPRVLVPNTAHSWCEVLVRDPVNPPSLKEVVAVASSGGNGKRYKTHNLGFLASKLRNVTSEMEPLSKVPIIHAKPPPPLPPPFFLERSYAIKNLRQTETINHDANHPFKFGRVTY